MRIKRKLCKALTLQGTKCKRHVMFNGLCNIHYTSSINQKLHTDKSWKRSGEILLSKK